MCEGRAASPCCISEAEIEASCRYIQNPLNAHKPPHQPKSEPGGSSSPNYYCLTCHLGAAFLAWLRLIRKFEKRWCVYQLYWNFTSAPCHPITSKVATDWSWFGKHSYVRLCDDNQMSVVDEQTLTRNHFNKQPDDDPPNSPGNGWIEAYNYNYYNSFSD